MSGVTLFAVACESTPIEFVRKLAELVPTSHLSQPDKEGCSPFAYAMNNGRLRRLAGNSLKF